MRAGSMSIRRAVVGAMTAAVLCGASGIRAQGQAPAAGAPAAADQFMFTSEAGLVIFQVKPAAAADFESAWSEIKTKLTASDKPDWKAMGDSMSIWKVAGAGAAADAPAIYVLQINPAVKTLSYDPGKILFAPTGVLWERKDADPLYKKIVDALAAGFNVLPLAKVK
jgi:hypothetical protein